MKKILILDAYDAASHRYWRESLIKYLPEYQWTSLALPPRFFRWRIRGNPLSWLDAEELKQSYDLIVATSMVDLSTIKGMHSHLAKCPTIVYFHENQFAYPSSDQAHGGNEDKVVNLYTALTSDKILFNSDYNRRSFLDGVKSFMAKMPDLKPDNLRERLEDKSEVCPVGIEEHLFQNQRQPDNKLKLIWNHRWEYDKGPDRLYLILKELQRRDVEFKIKIVGEQFQNSPREFDLIKDEFPAHLEQFGYLESRDEYEKALRESNFVLSTAIHDFQGISILEAAACACVPVLPERLAYPELFPDSCLYGSDVNDAENEASFAVDCLLKFQKDTERPEIDVSNFKWENCIHSYRSKIDSLLCK